LNNYTIFIIILDNDIKLKTNINNCIYNWIRFKSVEPNIIIESPLMNYVLSELAKDDVDEVVGNIINQLIINSSIYPDINKKLLNYITPTIIEITKHIHEIRSNDSLLIFNLLLETYAEYNIYIIIENFNDFNFIISSLIELYSIYPDSIEISYRFWTALQEQLNKSGYQSYKPQFNETYKILQEKTLNLYKYLTINNTDDISLDIFEIMFQNCFLMLNDYELLSNLYSSLKKEISCKTKDGDFTIETINNINVDLFYLYSIVFNVSANHQNIIREIIKLIPFFPNNEKINNIIIRIIGDLSEYSFNNNTEIEKQLNFLISFLENSNDKYQGLTSLMEFTKYCGMVCIIPDDNNKIKK